MRRVATYILAQLSPMRAYARTHPPVVIPRIAQRSDPVHNFWQVTQPTCSPTAAIIYANLEFIKHIALGGLRLRAEVDIARIHAAHIQDPIQALFGSLALPRPPLANIKGIPPKCAPS